MKHALSPAGNPIFCYKCCNLYSNQLLYLNVQIFWFTQKVSLLLACGSLEDHVGLYSASLDELSMETLSLHMNVQIL